MQVIDIAVYSIHVHSLMRKSCALNINVGCWTNHLGLRKDCRNLKAWRAECI